MRLIEEFFDDAIFDSLFRPQFRTKLLLGPQSQEKRNELFFGTLADVWEEENRIKAKIDLPGIDKKDIDIRVHDNIVEIRAEKKHEAKQEGKDFFRQERSFAGFYKAFSLPHKIDPKKIEAEYKNGVLEITAPKTEKEIQRIEVK